MTATIRINGVTINRVTITRGRNIAIHCGQVIIDGRDATPTDTKEIRIEVIGQVESITADACDSLHVSGSAGSVKTMSGDVRCGDVAGSVKTLSGDITCGNVQGDVDTMSGDIRRT